MRKIHVLHITYDMRIGGTEMVIKNLVEGIDAERFEVEILCLEPQLGPFGEQLVEQGIKITNLNWTSGFDTKLIRAIRHYLKANQIDILHCHQYTPWVYGALAAAFLKVKVIFTEHGRFYPDSSSWKRKIINPVLLRFTDHITAISEATKQALVEYEYIPEPKIQVIYNGIKPLEVDTGEVNNLRQKYDLPEDATIFGTVARLDPIKNQSMMIKAFADVLKDFPSAHLFIVGDGEERDKLEKLVDALSIQKNVVFTGYIAKPANYIALFDVFLLSSLSEGTSMTLLEAMSVGKPCIATDAGGNPEIIIHDKNGLVAPNNDKLAFSDKMKKLLSTSGLETFYGNNAKEIFEKKFSETLMNLKYADFYQQ
mgnify:CR=1 FL=1